MATPTDPKKPSPSMNAAALYREEIFTDRRVGTIQRLTPVTPTGETDSARPVLYVGQAQLMTTVGPLPISFEIDAKDLKEATEKFGDAAKVAVERTMKELQEMRREAASSIVIPQGGAGGLGPGGFGPGGLPGGGKIQVP